MTFWLEGGLDHSGTLIQGAHDDRFVPCPTLAYYRPVPEPGILSVEFSSLEVIVLVILEQGHQKGGTTGPFDLRVVLTGSRIQITWEHQFSQGAHDEWFIPGSTSAYCGPAPEPGILSVGLLSLKVMVLVILEQGHQKGGRGNNWTVWLGGG